MASFTDKTPTFNPYVQQLPVEEMVKVGMQKQQQYNEGYQKIQSNIDNVAGLDVARDVDKKYLESKLNALGNNLKTVAAGDFSNFQLVNSVNGMTNQITKDENVINAVSSTAWLKKQKAEMEKSISEGKSSAENQWDFSQKVGDYLNSEVIGEQFNGRYTHYIDVNKKWMDVMKSLHSDLSEQDVPYVKNDDGSINYNQTAAAMQRMSKESVSSAKIENALRSSLTPDEMNQLSISGRYTFKDFDTPDKLAVYSQTRFGKQIELNDKRIEELNGLFNLSVSNPEYQKKAQDAINDLQDKNKQLKGQLSNELKLISLNPDQAKANIYKNGAIEEFANTYAWEHNKENLMTNPVLESEHWEKKHALDISQFNLSKRSQNWKEFADKEGWKFQQANLDLAIAKQLAESGEGNLPFETYLGENTNIKDPLSAMVEDEKVYSQSASTGIVDMVKGIPGTNSNQIKSAIEKYKNGDPNWYIINNGNTKKAIPVEWRDEVDAIIDNQNRAKRLNIARSNVIKEVENSPEFVQDKNKLNDEINKYGSIVLKDRSGKIIKYTPQEIADFVKKRRVEPMVTGGPNYSSTVTYSSPLTEKEKLFSEANLQGHGEKIYKGILTTVNSYKVTNSANKEKAIQAKLLERSGTYIPRITTIDFSSQGGDITRRQWENRANVVLSRFYEKGGDEKLSKDDIEKGKKWLTSEGKGNIIYKKLTQGDRTYIVLEKEGEEVTIPLEANETRQLPKIDPNEPNEEYKEVVRAQYLNNGNTNPTGKYGDAYFGRSQMPNTGLDLKADLSWNKSNTAKQYIQLKLNTANGIVPLQLDEHPMPRESAIPFLNNLTKNQVKQLYLNSPLISEKDKQAIKNL